MDAEEATPVAIAVFKEGLQRVLADENGAFATSTLNDLDYAVGTRERILEVE